MGIISDAQKNVKPNCRYGHGDLERLRLFTEDRQPRGTIIPTYLEIPNTGAAISDGSGYTMTLYRCPKCGYTELFDDGVVNG